MESKIVKELKPSFFIDIPPSIFHTRQGFCVKAHNLGQVVGHGARTVCMITEIIGAEDIKATVQALQTIYKKNSTN